MVLITNILLSGYLSGQPKCSERWCWWIGTCWKLSASLLPSTRKPTTGLYSDVDKCSFHCALLGGRTRLRRLVRVRCQENPRRSSGGQSGRRSCFSPSNSGWGLLQSLKVVPFQTLQPQSTAEQEVECWGRFSWRFCCSWLWPCALCNRFPTFHRTHVFPKSKKIHCTQTEGHTHSNGRQRYIVLGLKYTSESNWPRSRSWIIKR